MTRRSADMCQSLRTEEVLHIEKVETTIINGDRTKTGNITMIATGDKKWSTQPGDCWIQITLGLPAFCSYVFVATLHA